jgi:hypothetical protein
MKFMQTNLNPSLTEELTIRPARGIRTKKESITMLANASGMLVYVVTERRAAQW